MGLVLGMMACLFLGCFSIRVVSGNSVPAEQVRAIEPGVTTRAEILEWFGAPEDYTDPSGLRRL
jgi:outer membrane protein assembly factor BamE (lipoprotein component of BamABCDE complex)